MKYTMQRGSCANALFRVLHHYLVDIRGGQIRVCVETKHRSQSLDGLGVAFQVLMPEDSGSNPEAGSIYFIRRSLSWFGLASTPAESLPNLNPAFLLSASRPFNRWPSVWFGSMLCGTACDSTDSREISNDGNPSHLPPLHYLPTIFTRWCPSWVPSSRLE